MIESAPRAGRASDSQIGARFGQPRELFAPVGSALRASNAATINAALSDQGLALLAPGPLEREVRRLDRKHMSPLIRCCLFDDAIRPEKQ